MSIIFVLSACGGEGAIGVTPAPATASELTVTSGPMHMTPAPDLERSREKYIPITDDCRLELGDVDRAPKFARGESALTVMDDSVLRFIAECVTSGPLAGRTLLLIGHADPRGTRDRNLDLGFERARTLGARFEGLGVDRSRIQETSRGERDATGTDEAGWRTDRRVDIVVVE